MPTIDFQTKSVIWSRGYWISHKRYGHPIGKHANLHPKKGGISRVDQHTFQQLCVVRGRDGGEAMTSTRNRDITRSDVCRKGPAGPWRARAEQDQHWLWYSSVSTADSG